MQTGMIRFQGLFSLPKRHLSNAPQTADPSITTDETSTIESVGQILAEPGNGWKPVEDASDRDAFILATQESGRSNTSKALDLAMAKRLKEAGAAFSYVPFVPGSKERDDHLMLAADTVTTDAAAVDKMITGPKGQSFSFMGERPAAE